MNVDTIDYLLAAFMLGVKTSEIANGKELESTPLDRLVDVLDGIRTGKVTLHPSGAEIRANFPDMTNVEGRRRDKQEIDRQIVEAILRRLLGRS